MHQGCQISSCRVYANGRKLNSLEVLYVHVLFFFNFVDLAYSS